MKLDDYCRKLSSHLETLPGPERCGFLAGAVAKGFGVDPSDVAIYHLDPESGAFSFVWPLGLQKSGSIPANSRDALVARCVREGSGLMDNRFAKTRHAGIFELVSLPTKDGQRKLPVQKILSVPLLAGGVPCGAIQVCRKAETPEEAGADFNAQDKKMLEAIGQEVAGQLQVS